MLYRLLADAVAVAHLLFVLFVVLGGLLVLRWPRLAWLHLPAALWGALVELAGWFCPLTPLENSFRRLAGGHGFETSFIEHLLLPLLYPAHLTRGMQIVLGAGVVLVNAVIYGLVIHRVRRDRRTRGAPRAPRGGAASRRR